MTESAAKTVEPIEMRLGKARVGPKDGVHSGATRRIRWIGASGGGVDGCRYRYSSNLVILQLATIVCVSVITLQVNVFASPIVPNYAIIGTARIVCGAGYM